MSQTTCRRYDLGSGPFGNRPRQGAVLFYLVLIHLWHHRPDSVPATQSQGSRCCCLLCGSRGFGTTVCYHRLLAHRTLRLNKLVEHFLIFCAIFNSSGLPRVGSRIIVIITPAPIHPTTSPAQSTAAFGGPTCAGFISLPADKQKWCPELSTDLQVLDVCRGPAALLSLCGGLVFGWQGFFWIGAIRLVYRCTCSVLLTA